MCRRILYATLPILLFAHMTAAAAESPEVDAVQLKSEGFLTPIIINGDPLYRSVTSLEIAGSLQSGKGTVTLNVGEVRFNNFGDIVTASVGQPIEVQFERVTPPAAEQGAEVVETRRLYKIKCIDGAFLDQMHLVISTKTSEPQRLLISRPQKGGKTAPIQVFDLHGTPRVQDAIPDAAHQQLQLAGVTRHFKDGALHELRIGGKLNGGVRLDLDPSLLEFKPFGDVSIAKAGASKSILCLLVRQDTPDPTQAGRVIYDLVTKETSKHHYALVLSPSPLGPHRLIVRMGDQIEEVVALHDPERQRISRLYQQSAEISPTERAAVDELIKRIGYSFNVTVDSNQITHLDVNHAIDLSELDGVIAKLPHLRLLSSSHASLGPAGLPSLRTLQHLQVVHFGHAAISDAGLSSLAPLTNLRGLHFYCCTGITDAGLPHLGKLKNLKSLQLYREDRPKPDDSDTPRITDAGLIHLAGLTNLERLYVYGQSLTDKGLVHLSVFSNLNELTISGPTITDTGLQQLKALKNLQRLNLNAPQVTDEGRKELKAALPMLKTSNR